MIGSKDNFYETKSHEVLMSHYIPTLQFKITY